MTKRGNGSSKEALLSPSQPSDKEEAHFSVTSLNSLVTKKTKKKSKKKKKPSSKEGELEDLAKLKKRKKRPRSDSVPSLHNEGQISLAVVQKDEEVEEVDVTTPFRDVAPLSVALKKDLETENAGEPARDQREKVDGGGGVWMPGEGGVTKPKKKRYKADGPAGELLVRYNLDSVPKFCKGVSAPGVGVGSDNSEHLSSADSPSPVHMCHSKYEGSSIKMVFQRNEVMTEKTKDKKKKDKKKKKHKKKKDKRQGSKEPGFKTPEHSTVTVPKASEELSLKVTVNRSKLSVTP